MVAGADNAYRLASKHGARVGFGTDILFDPRIAPRRGAMLLALSGPIPRRPG